MMNLGNAYRERIKGDRMERIKAVIQAYKQALILIAICGHYETPARPAKPIRF
jgi:hypothetical protein